jgi:hypothetical protein
VVVSPETEVVTWQRVSWWLICLSYSLCVANTASSHSVITTSVRA